MGMSREFVPTRVTLNKYLEPWYKQDSAEDAAKTLYDYLISLQGERGYLYRRFAKAIELYENVTCKDLVAWQFFSETDIDGPYQYNLVESVVDTLQAEIITQKTRPVFMTEAGDWEAKDKASKLTDFVQALFEHNRVYTELAQKICLDALVFGTGICKVFERDGHIIADRVFPYDVIVDDVDAALSGGRPQCMYHHRWVPRETLLEWFADDKEALRVIRAATGRTLDSEASIHVSMDVLKLTEAWHLAYGKDHPGRRMLTIEDSVILDEEYPHKYFPFVVLKYKHRVKGWWGKGIPEMIEGQQELINDLRDKMDAQVLGSSPFVWTKPGAKLTESEVSNRIWRVIESEEPPQYIAYNSIPPDLMQRFTQEVNETGTLVGVNQLMMRSELPPGLESGKAVRLYNTTKSKRFTRFADAYATFHLDLCRMFLNWCDACCDDGMDITMTTESGGFVQKIKYADIRIPKDSYVIKKEAVNFLSDDPAGRLSDIETLAGIFPEQSKLYLPSLMENPDVKSFAHHLTARTDAVEKACSAILRGERKAGEVAPTPYLPPELCVEIASVKMLEAQTAGCPAERLVELENWLAMVQALAEKAQPPAPPEAAAPGASEQAGPLPPVGPEQLPMLPGGGESPGNPELPPGAPPA